MKCPLCESDDTSIFLEKIDPQHGPRKYHKCPHCYLIFLAPNFHLGPEDEKKRYDMHKNNPENAGYVQSLLRLANPLNEKLAPNSHGLDFGCGQTSVLKLLFEQAGHTMDRYDPFYYPNGELLRNKYDFVACTEVVEHFHQPQKDFTILANLLKNGSILGIMTQMLPNEKDFRDWWYHRDPTHVCFYRKETFQWIGGWKHFPVEFPDDNVVIYTK